MAITHFSISPTPWLCQLAKVLFFTNINSLSSFINSPFFLICQSNKAEILMDISGSECTSECESGWTMYFDEFSYSSDQFNGVKGRSIYDIDEDLSMVSDASSGPPHNNFHKDREFCCEENGYFLNTFETENTKKKQIRKIKEQSGKKQNLYLDDTASSPVSNFQKDNTSFCNDKTYMEQIAGNSRTYSKGKSVMGKHFGFLKTSKNGKASSEKSGVVKGRKRG